VNWILFACLGVLVGGFGTMIGVGGGFILMPVLLWLYPKESPENLTAISLSVVFFNALSGSIAYARMKRIAYKPALVFAAAALPGTVLGALSTSYLPRGIFDAIIGTMLIAASVYLFVRPEKPRVHMVAKGGHWQVHMTDQSGETHNFSFNPWVGIWLSFVVGYLSSILGIGGGIIHVPAMTNLLHFPVHIATATSHFILVIMTFSGSMTHLIEGHLNLAWSRLIPLACGVIVGAQIGARVSTKIGGRGILRALSVALLFVGLRTIWMALR
jgi:uncharacterized membrane protein YfcA